MTLMFLLSRISRGSVMVGLHSRAGQVPGSLLHRLAWQLGQTFEQRQQLVSPFEADMRDDALFLKRLQLGGMLQKGASPGSQPERIGAPVEVRLAPSDEPARLQIGDRRHEIRLLDAESRRYARLARPGILIDQHEHRKLTRTEVDSAQSMVEIGKDDDLRPAQGIAHVTAEWRQFHGSLSLRVNFPSRAEYSGDAAMKTRRRGSCDPQTAGIIS